MIKFDLDGVLIDFVHVLKFLLNRDGYETVDDTQFQFTTNPHLSKSEMWEYVIKAYPLWDIFPIYPGVYTLLQKVWHNTATPINVITARPIESALYTHKLLNKVMGGIPHTVALVDDGNDKLNYLDPDDILVEDRRKTALHLAKAGVRTYLIDKPYNQIPHEHRISEITRIPDIRMMNLLTERIR